MTKSTEDLLRDVKLPPLPTQELSQDAELEALDRQFEMANQISHKPDSLEDSSSSSSISHTHQPSTESLTPPGTPPATALLGKDLRTLHDNLEERLQPFWSSVIPGRTVQLYVFASLQAAEAYRDALQAGIRLSSPEQLQPPISSQKVTTLLDGSFQALFRLSWERLCQHPGALHIAFGDPTKEEGKEYEFYIVAELTPPPPPPAEPVVPYSTYKPRAKREQQVEQPTKPPEPGPSTFAIHATPLTSSALRVLSDIDDTVRNYHLGSADR